MRATMLDTDSARVIYDLGANNGDDVAYYLHKADKVVALEAVPVLADRIRSRFAPEIAAGRVVVENCVLTVDPQVAETPFFVHRSNDLLSQLPRPTGADAAEFDEVTLPAATIAQLVARHGAPYYLKVDLEGFDNVLLKDLFGQGIFPPYISAEAHTIDVFCTLVADGGYDAFKIVFGEHVARDYPNHPIETAAGPVRFDFPSPHSSGPFGNDIRGDWLDGANFLRFLALVGPGWIDIHASRVDAAPAKQVRRQGEVAAHFLRALGLRLGRPGLMRRADRIWGVG
jgi:FkbM family methyltransferase